MKRHKRVRLIRNLFLIWAAACVLSLPAVNLLAAEGNTADEIKEMRTGQAMTDSPAKIQSQDGQQVISGPVTPFPVIVQKKADAPKKEELVETKKKEMATCTTVNTQSGALSVCNAETGKECPAECSGTMFGGCVEEHEDRCDCEKGINVTVKVRTCRAYPASGGQPVVVRIEEPEPTEQPTSCADQCPGAEGNVCTILGTSWSSVAANGKCCSQQQVGSVACYQCVDPEIEAISCCLDNKEASNEQGDGCPVPYAEPVPANQCFSAKCPDGTQLNGEVIKSDSQFCCCCTANAEPEYVSEDE